MANLPPELAQEVGRSRSAGGGTNIQHGDYIFMIRKCFFQKIQHACVITELMTIEAKAKRVFEGTKAVDHEPNPVGQDCSSVIDFDGKGAASAKNNVRDLVVGLFGLDNNVADDIVTKTSAEMVCDNSPAIGMLISCSTHAKPIRSRPGDFMTALHWSCVAKPFTGLNDVASVRARLDAFARGGAEACVKVALEQLQAARKAGATIVPQQAPTESSFTAPSLVSTPAVPSAPSFPPVLQADPVAAALSAGWLPHPQNSEYLYHPSLPQGQNVKKKTEFNGVQ